MIHTTFIVLHAAAGVSCFAAGVWCLGLRDARSWRFRLYLGCLLAMAGFVAAAVAAGWGGLEASERLVFTGLLLLALYMVWRAAGAARRLRRQDQAWRPAYIDDIGFTLISLFDGFVIVSAIDLGAPIWLVLVIAVAGVMVGIQSINRFKRRLAT